MKLLAILLIVLTTILCLPVSYGQVSAKFGPGAIKLTMGNSTQINYTLVIDLASPKNLQVEFQLVTLSPQLEIVEFDEGKNRISSNNGISGNNGNTSISGNNGTTSISKRNLYVVEIRADQIRDQIFNSSFYLKANYIGHAVIHLKSYLDDVPLTSSSTNNAILITRNEGLLDKIFMYSVIIFITVSYVNLGAQIDVENVRHLVANPKMIFMGLVIGIAVMPTCSWLAGHLIFQDQPMYRIGSFIYACAPAASASVLWTVMFDADKELALGLQIASTFGALLTMPFFLFLMDKSVDLEGQYTIKVPYLNLARTLVVLLVALLIGNRLGRNKRARQISQVIFRPLTMFVLIFIIVFSSIVYWYVYRMFNWQITLMAFTVTCATYILSGLLGYLIRRDINHMITISISSTYRNSGIAFAALVVAFQPPDIFIAYVPCLTQVVTTSLIGLVLYAIKSLKKM